MTLRKKKKKYNKKTIKNFTLKYVKTKKVEYLIVLRYLLFKNKNNLFTINVFVYLQTKIRLEKHMFAAI